MIHKSHILFTAKDFDEEDIAKGTTLTKAVLDRNERICRRCGRENERLQYPCPRIKKYRLWDQLTKREKYVLSTCLGLTVDNVITKNVITEQELGADLSIALILVNKELMEEYTVPDVLQNLGIDTENSYCVTALGLIALQKNIGLLK